MKNCPVCHRQFDDSSPFCQYCGVPLSEAEAPTGNTIFGTNGENQSPTGSERRISGTSDMPEFLTKYFEKGKKKLCRCLIYTAVFVLSIILVITMKGDATAIVGALFFFSFMTFMFAWVSYIQYPFSRKNHRWFLKYGNNGMLCGEINDEFMRRPNCNFAAGKEAIVDRTNGIRLIPYSQIAWAYGKEVHGNNIQSVIVYTKDGTKVDLIGTTVDELRRILPIVSAVSPNVIIGYGNDQKKQYREMYRR